MVYSYTLYCRIVIYCLLILMNYKPYSSPMNPTLQFHVGLMSGTSMDGIDAVLCSFNEDGAATLIRHVCAPFSEALKKDLMTLQNPSYNELHLEAIAGNTLAREYSALILKLLHEADTSPDHVTGIGAHGQTIRHRPKQFDGVGYSMQCLNPSLVAELTGIDVIADFRSRDIAANGQGAPLVPAFHAAQFGHEKLVRAILNLGGMANLTLLDPKQTVSGFDTGPANVLLDEWINHHKGLAFDEQGMWAKSGKVIPELLTLLLNEPYFSEVAPKSTGRDLFNMNWIKEHVQGFSKKYLPEDIQATFTSLTAITVIDHLKRYLPSCEELIICGGGVNNDYLVEQISNEGIRQFPNLQINSSEVNGVDPQTVEAIAFAWLSWCYFSNKPANLPAVTGAKGPRILGARYPR